MPGVSSESRAGHETARLKLARLRLTGQDARAAAIRQVAETGARALGVARASVWRLNEADSQIECLGRYHLPSGDFSSGEIVKAPPTFLAAISERRVLAVADVAT